MTSPTERARDRDRDAAVEVVEAACASGRIVGADRDKRVQELRRAQTLQDISVQLGELAVPTPAATATYSTPPPAYAAPPPAYAAPPPAYAAPPPAYAAPPPAYAAPPPAYAAPPPAYAAPPPAYAAPPPAYAAPPPAYAAPPPAYAAPPPAYAAPPPAYAAPPPAYAAPPPAYAAPPPAYAARPGPAPVAASWPAGAPSASIPYGPASGPVVPGSALGAAGGRVGRRIAGVAMAVALVSFVVPVAGVIIALVSSSRGFDFEGSSGATPTDGTTYLPGQAPGAHGVNVLTTDGFRAMVDAVAARTGSTSAYLAVAYPTYAVVEAPDPSGGGHYQTYYWNGRDLSDQGSAGSSVDQTLDLAAVDPQVLIDQLTTVRGRVTDPDSWYCLAQAPQGTTPQLSCYASNRFSDSTYTVVGLDGTLLHDSAAHS